MQSRKCVGSEHSWVTAEVRRSKECPGPLLCIGHEHSYPDHPDFAEAYTVSGERQEVALRFRSPAGMTTIGVGFELYQHQPNPFVGRTSIGFHLPAAATATLTVYDESGRTVFTQQGDFAKGPNAISVERSWLNTSGMLYYKLETATDMATKKMIQMR